MFQQRTIQWHRLELPRYREANHIRNHQWDKYLVVLRQLEIMNTEVIGARMIPANTAPMPTSAYVPGSPAGNSATLCTIIPTAPPAIAPRYKVGEKSPRITRRIRYNRRNELHHTQHQHRFEQQPAVERLIHNS